MAYAALIQAGAAGLSALSSSSARKSQLASQQAATESANRGVAAADESRQFFQSQYNKNRQLYGRIERDRARAIEKLNPDDLAARGLQRVRKSAQARAKRVEAAAHARGLERSGLTQQQLFDLDMLQAQEEAEVRFQAPLQAIQIQTAGLQPGLQREQLLTGGIQSSTSAQVSAAGTAAQIHAGFAATSAESAGERSGFGFDQLIGLATPNAEGKSGIGDIAGFLKGLGGN